MREPLRLPGYWYVDALPRPHPAYAASARDGSHVLTDRGKLPGTSGGVLYLRIAPDGVRCAAAQQNGDRAVLWNGTAWETGAPAPGVSPVMFRADGSLIYPDGSTGSQGWRYVNDNGIPIPSDWTIAPGTPFSRQLGEDRLFQWSEAGGVRVGQGDQGGCAIRYQGVLRLLESGDCQFVRLSRSGDELAVSIVKLLDQSAVIYWLTVAEIAELPLYPAKEEQKPPPKPPTPEPVPMPRKWTPLMPNRVDVVQRVKDAHPDEWAAMNAGHGDLRFIKRLAWELHQIDANFGLNGKRGTDVLSEDAVAYKNPTVDNGPEVADVVQNHGAPTASPTWINVTKDSQGFIADGTQDRDAAGNIVPGAGAKWIQPAPIAGSPQKPPAPNTELEAAKRRIAELEALVIQLRDRPVTDLTYFDLEQFANEVRAAYVRGDHGRHVPTEPDVPFMTALNLFWRWVVEKHPRPQIIDEARIRGEGRIPQ